MVITPSPVRRLALVALTAIAALFIMGCGADGSGSGSNATGTDVADSGLPIDIAAVDSGGGGGQPDALRSDGGPTDTSGNPGDTSLVDETSDATEPPDDTDAGASSLDATDTSDAGFDATDADATDATDADANPDATDTSPDVAAELPDGCSCLTDDHCLDGADLPACITVQCVDCACEVIADANQNDEPCDNFDPCSTNASCLNGLCVGGDPVDCSVLATPCSPAFCDAQQGGCVVAPLDEGESCDDGDACTDGETCQAGLCTGGLSPCDDGDVCNGTESCDAETGSCGAGTPLGCDDGDPCTGQETCHPEFGCVLGPPPQCETGNICDGVGSCEVGIGCVYTDPLVCDDGDPCTGIEVCDADSGCVQATESCEDGDACNGAETCGFNGECEAGDPLVCDDEDICTGTESCDPATGCVAGTALDCQDGDACNGAELCHATFGCGPGVPLSCDDGNGCNGVETCDQATGCVAGQDMDCGLYTCTPGGCNISCGSQAGCLDGAYCDQADTNGNGNTTECLIAQPNGASCASGNAYECASGYCQGGLCCSGGTCCALDEDCPISSEITGISQGSYSETSLFSKVIITETQFGLQTIVPTQSGALSKVRLRLEGPLNTPVTVVVRVHDGGLPSASSLMVDKTFQMSHSDPDGPKWYDAIFQLPPALVAGSTYAIEVRGSNFGPSCSGCAITWRGDENDPYPAGTVYRSFDSGDSWGLTAWNDDTSFETGLGVTSCVDGSCLLP